MFYVRIDFSGTRKSPRIKNVPHATSSYCRYILRCQYYTPDYFALTRRILPQSYNYKKQTFAKCKMKLTITKQVHL